ncbi:protein GLUTAMINE DUMPER 5-like [Gastrolobium bilobum]|uniref:protein GLUTAMINE DUMPER 5-like n=1 Tax=Gastrolobium bilobum TaxID=150636 RepID=UPI002AAF0EE2|nr:protein GLUTAMINE DUMPER 5-like [Gastrolobium bilobum]
MRTISSTTTTTTYSTTSSLAPSATESFTSVQHSSWHSPVPYLFGGLAAMLGLIAFALLILACSYWKLSGQLQNEENGDRDLENAGGEKASDSAKNESAKVYEEKILVIMAGNVKPTFLATPACSKSSSFGDGVENHSDKDLKNHETIEKSEKEEMDNHVQATTTTPLPQPQETQQQNQSH